MGSINDNKEMEPIAHYFYFLFFLYQTIYIVYFQRLNSLLKCELKDSNNCKYFDHVNMVNKF